MQTIYRDDRMPDVEIRWNGGATFNIWVKGGPIHGYHTVNGWTNTDCFTHYGTANTDGGCTPDEAAEAAEEHFDMMAQEVEAESA